MKIKLTIYFVGCLKIGFKIKGGDLYFLKKEIIIIFISNVLENKAKIRNVG